MTDSLSPKQLPPHLHQSSDSRYLTCHHCWSTFSLEGGSGYHQWIEYHTPEKHDPEWKRDKEAQSEK